MPTVRRTTTGWLVAAVLALVASTAGLARPAGAADGTCDGVWVVVDARALGGELTTRCAEGDPTSGLEALQLAGHTYGFVPRQPGLVCTIDARPDPCNGAPSDAYWGYYHATAGGDWTYATRGAGNRDPEPGSVEGWAFGDDAEPGRRPPSNAPEPAPSPTPEPRPAATPSSSPTREPAAPATSTSDPAADTATSEEPASAPSSEPTADPATDPSTGPEAPEATLEADGSSDETTSDGGESAAAPTPGETLASTPEQSGGPPDADDGAAPVGPIVGGVLVAGIAGAGVLRSRRRDDGEA